MKVWSAILARRWTILSNIPEEDDVRSRNQMRNRGLQNWHEVIFTELDGHRGSRGRLRSLLTLKCGPSSRQILIHHLFFLSKDIRARLFCVYPFNLKNKTTKKHEVVYSSAVVADRFHIALFSALEQIHCAHCRMWFWVTSFLSRGGVPTALFGCYMAGATWNCCTLGAFCVHHTAITSCKTTYVYRMSFTSLHWPSWLLSHLHTQSHTDLQSNLAFDLVIHRHLAQQEWPQYLSLAFDFVNCRVTSFLIKIGQWTILNEISEGGSRDRKRACFVWHGIVHNELVMVVPL